MGGPSIELHNIIPDGAVVYGFAVAVLYFDADGNAKASNSYNIDNGTWTDLIGAVTLMEADIIRRMRELDAG